MSIVTIQLINPDMKCVFIEAMQSSRALHHPWLQAPCDKQAFDAYYHKYHRSECNVSYWLMVDNDIAGVINLNEIVRGCFQSAYLGFYVASRYAGKGVMTQGLRQVIKLAFGEHHLHRLEANIQPENAASIALVKRCGFQQEGYSPKYLKINDAWCDHERWALVSDKV